MRKPFITKESLEKLYVKEEKTMRECANILGVSVGAVHKYLKKYGVKSRPTITPKTIAKISKTKKENPKIRKGWKLSEETKQKISASHKNKFLKPSEFGGHKKKRSDGYIAVYCPEHPLATKDGYVMEHVLVMERAVGRYITRKEVVHHKNHIRTDNRLENLELMTFKAHSGLHMKERWLKRKENIA